MLQLQEVFAEDWAFATQEILDGDLWYPPLRRSRRDARPRNSLRPGRGSRRDATGAGRRAGLRHSRVAIVTPYFLPDARDHLGLNVAAMRGVAVDILLPEKNNLITVQWASPATLWQVLERGCRVWLTPPPFDHTKLMLVDGLWSLIGSGNWDPRSLRLNFEFNVECYDRGLAASSSSLSRPSWPRRQITLAELDGRRLPVNAARRRGTGCSRLICEPAAERRLEFSACRATAEHELQRDSSRGRPAKIHHRRQASVRPASHDRNECPRRIDRGEFQPLGRIGHRRLPSPAPTKPLRASRISVSPNDIRGNDGIANSGESRKRGSVSAVSRLGSQASATRNAPIAVRSSAAMTAAVPSLRQIAPQGADIRSRAAIDFQHQCRIVVCDDRQAMDRHLARRRATSRPSAPAHRPAAPRPSRRKMPGAAAESGRRTSPPPARSPRAKESADRPIRSPHARYRPRGCCRPRRNVAR